MPEEKFSDITDLKVGLPDTKILNPGDIVLVAGKGWLSKQIMFLTNSKWSHAALYVGGGRQAVLEAVDDGVEENAFVTTSKGHTRIAIRRLPGLTVEQAEAIKTAAYTKLNKPYDWMQLVTIGVYELVRKHLGIRWSGLVKNSKRAMICSELVAVAYRAAGVEFSKEDKMVTPDMLGDDSRLVTVYEAPLP